MKTKTKQLAGILQIRRYNLVEIINTVGAIHEFRYLERGLRENNVDKSTYNDWIRILHKDTIRKHTKKTTIRSAAARVLANVPRSEPKIMRLCPRNKLMLENNLGVRKGVITKFGQKVYVLNTKRGYCEIIDYTTMENCGSVHQLDLVGVSTKVNKDDIRFQAIIGVKTPNPEDIIVDPQDSNKKITVEELNQTATIIKERNNRKRELAELQAKIERERKREEKERPDRELRY